MKMRAWRDWSALGLVGLGLGLGACSEPRPAATRPAESSSVAARGDAGATETAASLPRVERREPLPSLEEERRSQFRRENAEFARLANLAEQVGELPAQWNDARISEAGGRLVVIASASGPTLREAYDAAVIEGHRRFFRERGVRGTDVSAVGGRYARLSVGGVQVWVRLEAPLGASTPSVPEPMADESPRPPQWWLGEPLREPGRVTVTVAAEGPGLREALRAAVDAGSELARREAGAGPEAPTEVVQSGSIRLADGTYRAFVMVRARTPGE